MQNFIRFLKENNCYKKFFNYFYSQESIVWRKEQHYNSNYNEFVEWAKSLLKNSNNSIIYVFNLYTAHNIYALVFMCAFRWTETKEGRLFWLNIKENAKKVKIYRK